MLCSGSKGMVRERISNWPQAELWSYQMSNGGYHLPSGDLHAHLLLHYYKKNGGGTS